MTAFSTFLDRVQMTVSGTPGAGAITLAAATSGRQSFASAGAVDGSTVSYLIEDGTNWELGRGTYSSTGPTLTRTNVIESSNSGSAINATSSALVSATVLAEDLKAYQTNFMQFGADPAGINDNSTALSNALATLSATGGQLYIPPGKYLFTSAVSFNFPNAYCNVSIVGAGADATELYWSASDGLIFTAQSPLNSLNIRDVSITTGWPGVYTGVQFIWSSTSAPTYFFDSQSTFERVAFRGTGSNIGLVYWSTAVVIGVSYVNFISCLFFGTNEPGTGIFGIGIYVAGNSISATTNGSTATSSSVLHFASVPAGIVNGMYAIDNTSATALFGTIPVASQTSNTVTLSENVLATVNSGDAIVFTTYAVNINIDSCGFGNLNVGIQIGTGAQGITAVNSTFIESNIGIFSDGSTGVAEINVGPGCEFACSQYGIFCLANNGTSGGHDDGVQVSGALFANSDGTGTHASIYSTFSNTVIQGNNFEGVSGALGVYLNGTNGIVSGNLFSIFATAIEAASQATNIKVTGNQYVTVTTKFTDSGTGDVLLEGPTTITSATPSNPTSTTSTSGVMMGLNQTITPQYTLRVLAIVTGNGFVNSSLGAQQATIALRYGTGTAPTNGAALAGPPIATTKCLGNSATVGVCPFTLQAIVTGLTRGTTYWFDLSVATSTAADAAGAQSINVSLIEI